MVSASQSAAGWLLFSSLWKSNPENFTFSAMSRFLHFRPRQPPYTLSSTPRGKVKERARRLPASPRGEPFFWSHQDGSLHIFLLSVTVIHVEGLDKMERTPAAIMEELLEQHQVIHNLFAMRRPNCFRSRRRSRCCCSHT